MMQQATKFKSIKLTSQEKTKLKKFVSEYPNMDEAAKEIGIKNRSTLGRIISIGSGSYDNICKVRTAIA